MTPEGHPNPDKLLVIKHIDKYAENPELVVALICGGVYNECKYIFMPWSEMGTDYQMDCIRWDTMEDAWLFLEGNFT